MDEHVRNVERGALYFTGWSCPVDRLWVKLFNRVVVDSSDVSWLFAESRRIDTPLILLLIFAFIFNGGHKWLLILFGQCLLEFFVFGLQSWYLFLRVLQLNHNPFSVDVLLFAELQLASQIRYFHFHQHVREDMAVWLYRFSFQPMDLNRVFLI